MINIVVVNPEIPQNTGNIARTCACVNAPLHIILPCSFDLSDKAVKRAGLDYWKDVQVIIHEDISKFFETIGKNSQILATSPRGKNLFTSINYKKDCYVLFGRESVGLDETLLQNFKTIYLPMAKNQRSLNLSNCVAIVTYEYIRQHPIL